jgi:hypothetical protein
VSFTARPFLRNFQIMNVTEKRSGLCVTKDIMSPIMKVSPSKLSRALNCVVENFISNWKTMNWRVSVLKIINCCNFQCGETSEFRQ